MKNIAVLCSRNDNYGGNLIERSTFCINSMIDTFDDVWYIDWNSETHSLIYDIKDNLELRGNLHHIVITPEYAQHLTNFDTDAQKCCEVLARNIGIRRALEQNPDSWITSTNIDIVAPKRDDMINYINTTLNKNTFYTISRRHCDRELIKQYDYKNWKELRQYLYDNVPKREFKECVVESDSYSIINCCGDFQIAHSSIWNDIRGFEESLIYSLYSDTNVQKKAVVHGYNLEALYDLPLYHIDHGKGGGGFMSGINRKVNDMKLAVIDKVKTYNSDIWGFSDIEIEEEIL